MKGRFRSDDLERISGPTYEEVVTGDFVRLRSGSPLGVVSDASNGMVSVTYLTAGFPTTRIPWVCFEPVRANRG